MFDLYSDFVIQMAESPQDVLLELLLKLFFISFSKSVLATFSSSTF